MPTVLLLVAALAFASYPARAEAASTSVVPSQAPEGHSSIISGPTPDFALSFGASAGFTMHFSVDLFGTVHYAWTWQPFAVYTIDTWLRAHPNATIAAQEIAGALACEAVLPGLGGIACATVFAVWGAYLLEKIHDARLLGVCVTFKLKVGLFHSYDPRNLNWDKYPYVDAGSWCDRHIYTFAPGHRPNPQGPSFPTTCQINPSYPPCL